MAAVLLIFLVVIARLDRAIHAALPRQYCVDAPNKSGHDVIFVKA